MLVASDSEVPEWLSSLLLEKFFNACIIHEDARKNEKNVFCMDCCEGICPHCVKTHRSHRLLQIRRYVYHDVIRLADVDKFMDCALMQSYTTNSAKVVFLNPRPQRRRHRASSNLCVTCDRNLQESSLFCSISCKVQYIIRTGNNISIHLRKCEFLALPETGSDDGQMTPYSFLESAGSVRTDSGSSSGGGVPAGVADCPNLICTATTEVVRKKRSNLQGFRSVFRRPCSPVSRSAESMNMISRRKGASHRAPLH